MSRSLFAPLLAVTMLAIPAAAQDAPSAESPLDELLQTPISTAAKYEQQMDEVAASVTVITAEEISRYGWRTLADVLNSVRGVYTTYDRVTTKLGVLGIGLPFDQNNRFLVLLDGHPMTEAVYGTVAIDDALAIDLSSLSRIEFVRGPGSAMYGTGAMFGVINLITKSETERSSLMVGSGSNHTQQATARAGFRHGDFAGSISAAWQESNGRDHYYREFDTPETNHGVARGLDFSDYKSVLLTFAWRDLRVLALNSSRIKGAPTAPWGTIFGDRASTFDRRTFLGFEYDRKIAPGQQLFIAGHHDRFHVDARHRAADFGFPMDWQTVSESQRSELEARYVRDLRPNHRVIAGEQWNRASRASYAIENELFGFGANAPFTVLSAFAQSEWEPRPYLSITAGASYDRYSFHDHGHATPRGAVIVRPNERSTLKFLYGTGFRMPNVLERYLMHENEKDGLPLEAEFIRTLEAVWEYRVTPDVLFSASVFDIHVRDVLRETFEDGHLSGYANASHLTSRGGGVQIDHRRNNGVWSYLSFSWQEATDEVDALMNSPAYLVKAGISTPSFQPLQGALELQYGSSRETSQGARVGDSVLANVNVSRSLTDWLSIGVSVKNVLDARYSTPTGPDMRQDAIAQDGRTFFVRLMARGR